MAGPRDDVDDRISDILGLEDLHVREAGGGLLPDLIPQVTLKLRGDRARFDERDAYVPACNLRTQGLAEGPDPKSERVWDEALAFAKLLAVIKG
jgi:hypothetical protein